MLSLKAKAMINFALAVLFLVAGIYAFVTGMQTANTVNECRVTPGCVSTGSSLDEQAEAANTRQLLGIIGIIAGLAGFAQGTYQLLKHGRARQP